MPKAEPSAPDLEERDELNSLSHEVHQNIPYAIHVDVIQPVISIQHDVSVESRHFEAQEQSRNDGSVHSQGTENKADVSLQRDDGIKRGEWDVGLCGCFRHCVPNCWMSMFCPYISLAQIVSRLGMLSYEVALILLLAIGFVQGAATSYSMTTFAASINNADEEHRYKTDFIGYIAQVSFMALITITWQVRTKVRERFELPGSCFGDFVAVVCCLPCVICQAATHVKSYKPGTCDFGPRDTLPAYTCN